MSDLVTDEMKDLASKIRALILVEHPKARGFIVKGDGLKISISIECVVERTGRD